MDDSPDDEGLGWSRPEDGLIEMLRQAGLNVPDGASLEDLLNLLANQMVSQLKRRGGGPEAPVTWQAAKDAARHQIASLGPDPVPDGRRTREIADAVHLVELWLDDYTVFPQLTLPPVAWSRADWIEQTMPKWQEMIEPVTSTIAAGLQATMGERLAEMGAAPELTGFSDLLQPLLRQAADGMFGSRLGKELGRIATDIVTATDLGFPLTPKLQVAVLPTNLAAAAEGLGVPETDVLLYHAIREAARQRLFGEVAWIGPQLVALVQHYAREIKIDPDSLTAAIEQAMPEQITPETLSQFEGDINTVMFDPGKTDEQLAILERLETLIALVEGWVDFVAGQATAKWLPSAAALAETVRRRRASGGPAAEVFSTLLGLSIRPRRLREAEAFWDRLTAEQGVGGRDEAWNHPDRMPAAADLADPEAYLARLNGPAEDDPFDAELRRLLDGEAG
ncbi:MAG: zinc-dependent metalloprotease [Propionibacteriaceae bacterium]|jgi:putative hydrolase|nr:zinc-dependent metalloprotease [Propionibacteriaceae bacterium]